MSSGNATIAAAVTNPIAPTSTVYNNVTTVTDGDLVTISSQTYSQSLYDGVILSFVVTPTVAGSLLFSYVFGR